MDFLCLVYSSRGESSVMQFRYQTELMYVLNLLETYYNIFLNGIAQANYSTQSQVHTMDVSLVLCFPSSCLSCESI